MCTLDLGRKVICVDPPPRSRMPTVFLLLAYRCPKAHKHSTQNSFSKHIHHHYRRCKTHCRLHELDSGFLHFPPNGRRWQAFGASCRRAELICANRKENTSFFFLSLIFFNLCFFLSPPNMLTHCRMGGSIASHCDQKVGTDSVWHSQTVHWTPSLQGLCVKWQPLNH